MGRVQPDDTDLKAVTAAFDLKPVVKIPLRSQRL
jgi:hypothetical protein